MPRKIKSKSSRPVAAAESWDNFHQQYHSAQYRNSANNPSTLQRMGYVPDSFDNINTINSSSRSRRGRRLSASSRSSSIVDQLLMMRDDSVSLCGSSHSSGGCSARQALRADNIANNNKKGRFGFRKRKGNIKIGQHHSKASPWTRLASLFRK